MELNVLISATGMNQCLLLTPNGTVTKIPLSNCVDMITYHYSKEEEGTGIHLYGPDSYVEGIRDQLHQQFLTKYNKGITIEVN